MASFHKSTHRDLTVGHGLKITNFYPRSTFTTYGDGLDQSDSPALVGIERSAISFVHSQVRGLFSDIGYNSGYTTGRTTHAYLQQYHNGFRIANAVANVAWKDNKLVAFGCSFVKIIKESFPNIVIMDSKPTIDVQTIIPKAEQALNGLCIPHTVGLEYLVRPNGSLSLVHAVQIRNDELGTWYEAFVDAHFGDILSVTDFVCQVSYTVLPITKQAPKEEPNDGFEILTDPQDMIASPSGWHTVGGISTTTTAGNNVVAYKLETSVQSSSGLNFNYSFDESQDPTTTNNLNAARVNAFYVINSIHDFAYRYGFTEAAYNFQSKNFDKGGKGGDRVMVSVHDSNGYNTATFTTPPDGDSGTCRLFIWTKTNPNRDGALVNSMIVHEMTHGITNRMIGGGTARCLQTLESGGLGEGWSDAMADWTEQKSADVSDYIIGAYETGNDKGNRTYPYSTDPKVNPLKYSDVGKFDEVHKIGEVWANILHNVYAALVKEHGFSSTAKTNPGGSEGNIVYLHHFIDSLSLINANPTFVSARDAWIQADVNRYGGVNKCLLWTVFASRGLGVGAADYVDSTDVPKECDDSSGDDGD